MKRANVGDYVKVIKKVSYYNNVDIGDVGIVNYVSDSGKYSVHIEGKKNPKETLNTYRCYGKPYDFWIPFNSCEIVTDTVGVIEDDVLYKCLFNNADAYTATWDDIPNDIKELVEIGILTKEEALAKCSNNLNQEREVIKVKEIRNQKVVDLYYERQFALLEENHKKEYELIKKEDKHYQFIESIQKQIDNYVKENEEDLKGETLHVNCFSMTKESSKKIDDLESRYAEKKKELQAVKAEVLAMISGCETYEQEMEILKSYKIVDKNNRMISGE